MMNSTVINQAIQAAFAADAYCLGAHWIYDWELLDSLNIDWQNLNAPQAKWHTGKQKGDYTHYGDHGLWLHQFVLERGRFDISVYAEFWRHKMQTYTGYIDASSRETLKILEAKPSSVVGSNSSDLSIIGRIAPLLLVNTNEENFLESVESFVKFTHNCPRVLKAASYFASVLFATAAGSTIEKALHETKIAAILQETLNSATASKGADTSNTIRNFGPACGVNGAFEGAVHLLCSYENYQYAIIANARAGGDSAARGMLVGMIMGAAGCTIPGAWQKKTG